MFEVNQSRRAGKKCPQELKINQNRGPKQGINPRNTPDESVFGLSYFRGLTMSFLRIRIWFALQLCISNHWGVAFE